MKLHPRLAFILSLLLLGIPLAQADVDLVAKTVQIEADANAQVVIQNIATGAVPASRVKIKIIPPSGYAPYIIEALRVPVAGEFIASETFTARIPACVKIDLQGTYVIGYEIDPDRELGDLDYSNNTGEFTASCNPPPTGCVCGETEVYDPATNGCKLSGPEELPPINAVIRGVTRGDRFYSNDRFIDYNTNNVVSLSPVNPNDMPIKYWADGVNVYSMPLFSGYNALTAQGVVVPFTRSDSLFHRQRLTGANSILIKPLQYYNEPNNFHTCIKIPRDGTYLFHFGGDDEVAFKVDGKAVAECKQPFCFWPNTTLPYPLTQGDHKIQLTLRNYIASTGELTPHSGWLEIFDQSSSSFAEAKTEADLRPLYTTRNAPGNTSGFYQQGDVGCPTGYSLNPCSSSGVPVCTKIQSSVCRTVIRTLPSDLPPIPLVISYLVVNPTRVSLRRMNLEITVNVVTGTFIQIDILKSGGGLVYSRSLPVNVGLNYLDVGQNQLFNTQGTGTYYIRYSGNGLSPQQSRTFTVVP